MICLSLCLSINCSSGLLIILSINRSFYNSVYQKFCLIIVLTSNCSIYLAFVEHRTVLISSFSDKVCSCTNGLIKTVLKTHIRKVVAHCELSFKFVLSLHLCVCVFGHVWVFASVGVCRLKPVALAWWLSEITSNCNRKNISVYSHYTTIITIRCTHTDTHTNVLLLICSNTL